MQAVSLDLHFPRSGMVTRLYDGLGDNTTERTLFLTAAIPYLRTTKPVDEAFRTRYDNIADAIRIRSIWIL